MCPCGSAGPWQGLHYDFVSHLMLFVTYAPHEVCGVPRWALLDGELPYPSSPSQAAPTRLALSSTLPFYQFHLLRSVASRVSSEQV